MFILKFKVLYWLVPRRSTTLDTSVPSPDLILSHQTHSWLVFSPAQVTPRHSLMPHSEGRQWCGDQSPLWGWRIGPLVEAHSMLPRDSGWALPRRVDGSGRAPGHHRLQRVCAQGLLSAPVGPVTPTPGTGALGHWMSPARAHLALPLAGGATTGPL